MSVQAGDMALSNEDKIVTKAKVVTYMRSRRTYTNPRLTTEMAARDLGMSRATLVRYMRRELHTTFADYLADVRLEYCRKEMERSTLSLEMIARSGGFASRQTFIMNFKRKYGVPPSEVRKKK